MTPLDLWNLGLAMWLVALGAPSRREDTTPNNIIRPRIAAWQTQEERRHG